MIISFCFIPLTLGAQIKYNEIENSRYLRDQSLRRM